MDFQAETAGEQPWVLRLRDPSGRVTELDSRARAFDEVTLAMALHDLQDCDLERQSFGADLLAAVGSHSHCPTNLRKSHWNPNLSLGYSQVFLGKCTLGCVNGHPRPWLASSLDSRERSIESRHDRSSRSNRSNRSSGRGEILLRL